VTVSMKGRALYDPGITTWGGSGVGWDPTQIR
jgi:hypothetical protein